MRTNLVAFASPIHPEEEWRRDLEQCLEKLRDVGLEFHEHLIVGQPHYREVKLSKRVHGTIIVFLTGGTSKSAAKILQDVAKPLIFIASPRHNALPSALEANALLREQAMAKIVMVREGYAEEVRRFLEKAKSLREESKAKILSFGGLAARADLKEASPERLAEMFNVEIEEVPYKDLEEAIIKVGEEEVETMEKRLRASMAIKDTSLTKAIRLYLATKSLLEARGADGFTFNCFNLLSKIGSTPCLTMSLLSDEGYVAVCEGEIQSIAASVLTRKLLKREFFMSNVSSYTGRTLLIAHCTAPASMAERRIDVLPHFESGLPAGLDVELKRGAVTLFNVDKGLKEIVAFKGYMKASFLKKEGFCRTQAEVEVEEPVELLSRLVGGHLLMVYGDVMEELREIAELLNLGFREL